MDEIKRKTLWTSPKLYIGIGLLIISLTVGRITQFTFLVYIKDPVGRNLSIIGYLLSWIPHILGMVLVGKEVTKSISQYFSPLYYYRRIKNKIYNKNN